MGAPQIMFMHSRCCMGHWKLAVKEDEYKLECEGCGRDSGVRFTTKPAETKIEKCCNGIIEFMLKDGKFEAICDKCEKDLGLETDMEPPEHVACHECTEGKTVH